MSTELKAAHSLKIELSVDGGNDIGGHVTQFEWSSFINGGYVVKASVQDPYFNILTETSKKYLSDGRNKETEIKFKLKWADGKETDKITAYMTSLQSFGEGEGGVLEFIAIDPPTFKLNEGKGDGKVYEGKVSDVIKKVCEEVGVKVEVSDTQDNSKNVWPMMRQDPKTFIRSLLDWSASITKNKTHWIVASVDDKLIIKEQADLKSKDFGVYHYNMNKHTGSDILKYELMADNFVSPLQTKLITSGISAISGQFIDDKSLKDKTIVEDKNTDKKANVNITAYEGFKKPSKEWATSIKSIPEHNGGELGIKYSDYIDGRARGMFLNMLNLVMRMKITITGEPEMDDSSELGVSKCTISWKNIDGEPYFLSGKWLVYGWHHIIDCSKWITDVYLSRIDYDASAKKV
jgi:hypothetical protein